jgi:predicted dehydrogenase/type 1 glutamine amidotransferase
MSPIKTLLLFREGKHHDFPTNAATLAAFLNESGEFAVTPTGDFSILASPQLDAFDLILNFTFNHEINAAEEQGLLRFVADGKGLMGLHTATITFPQSAGYKRLIGGWLDGHAPYGPFPVKIADTHHPVTAGLSDFVITDELYACTYDPLVKVLATARWKDKDQPMVWTKPYGKGRVCYVALGHDAAAFADANFRRLVHRACAWAAGRRPTRFYPAALFTPNRRIRDSYRAAIIGSGNIARNHVQGYRGVGEIPVVGAYDIKSERLTWFKEQTGVDRLYSDLDEMLRKERPELVSVCTWPDSHCDLVVKAAQSGVVRGILCEKPMAITMGEARRMLDVCDRHHVKLAVNHQRRFYSHHQKAKDLIDSGALGNIQKLWASVTTFYKDPYVWATHVTDMVRFYAGDVESVMGQISAIEPQPAPQGGHRYSLNGVGYLKFTSGARGVFDFEINQGQIHVIGDRGQMIVPMDTKLPETDLRVSTVESPQWSTVNHAGCGWHTGPMCIPSVHDLIEAIEDDRQPINSGIEGAASLEILLAVFESARLRGRVNLPLAQNDYPLAEDLWARPV